MTSRRAAIATVAAPALLTGCLPSAVGIEGGFVGAGFERGHRLRDAAALAALRGQRPAFERRVDVLVLGGGVAGLAAADTLCSSNRSFALLELEDRVGGNARGHVMRAGERSLACPLGAHYLPVPGAAALDVQRLLVSLALAQGEGARFALTREGQKHLAHAPQERLWWPADAAHPQGRWQSGLLPTLDMGAATTQAYARFAQRLRTLMAQQRFSVPVEHQKKGKNQQFAGISAELDAIYFDSWLRQEGFGDPHLRWYLDYCCRDDYGASLGEVSAWAGLHYFASRHGFRAPGEAADEEDDRGVLAWPQGNAWLTERVAQRIEAQRPGAVHTGQVVLGIEEAPSREVVVRGWHAASGQVSLWRARAAIVALPLRAAARVLGASSAADSPSNALAQAAQAQRTSAWLVANVALREPLIERERAASTQMAWDNVRYGSAGLGYVNAAHQLIGTPAAPVLTYYHALGAGKAAAQSLLELPWTHWRDVVLAELSGPHPDAARQIARIDLMRYGHAMSVPAPGVYASAANGALAELRHRAPSARLRFAHADLAGYSVFEEAWSLGVAQARALS
jgi:Flavin containing amine oxidoreductase